MIALNRATTQDEFVDDLTRLQPDTHRVDLIVLGAWIDLQMLSNTGVAEEDFISIPPGSYSLDRDVGGAAVRSNVAGDPAQVTMWLLEYTDLPSAGVHAATNRPSGKAP